MGRKRTHCSRGHAYAEVGRYKSGHCRECGKIDRARRKGSAGRPAGVAEVDESMRANTILALVDQKDRAATWWEREAIQERIDALTRKGA